MNKLSTDKMNTEVTVLVNSCDKYEDAWEPFFRLFHINWENCPYRVVLNTERKKYHCDFMDIESINYEQKGTWSQRLKSVLEKIDSEFILFFLEDFFLQTPVNVGSFNMALDYMKNDSDIGYIGLKYNRSYTFKEESKKSSKENFINKDELVTCNRTNTMTALWRKEWLISLLRMHETPWEFEKYGSIRSKRSDKKVLIINNNICAPVFNYEIDPEYGMGIWGGKWRINNHLLFEKHNIEVNFQNLGILGEEDAKITSSYLEKKNKKNIREVLYIVKHFLKISKSKIRKKIREVRSLI